MAITKADKAQEVEKLFTRDFLLVSTMNLAIFFSYQMLNVGMPVYVAQLGAGTQVVGLVTTLTVGAAIVLRIFAGPLLDRMGRIGTLVWGVVVTMCAVIAYAIFPIVGVVLGFRLLQGVGWGLSSNATSTLVADVLPKKRFAEGMGYFAMTNAIASAFAPAVALKLLGHSNPALMLYVAAGVVALALIAAVVQVSCNRRDAAAAAESAADAEGAEGAGDAEGATTAGAEAETEGMAGIETFTGWETFFERRAILPGVLMGLVDVGFGAITTFIALHGAARGVEDVSIYFLMYAILTFVGRPPIGKFVDRFGYRLPAIFSGICTAGTMVLIAVSSSTLVFAIAGVLAGLGIGSAMGTFQAMAIAPVEPWRRGVATSTYMTIFDIGIASGSLVGGLIAGAVGYANMYLIVALFPLLTSVVAAIFVKKGAEER